MSDTQKYPIELSTVVSLLRFCCTAIEGICPDEAAMIRYAADDVVEKICSNYVDAATDEAGG